MYHKWIFHKGFQNVLCQHGFSPELSDFKRFCRIKIFWWQNFQFLCFQTFYFWLVKHSFDSWCPKIWSNFIEDLSLEIDLYVLHYFKKKFVILYKMKNTICYMTFIKVLLPCWPNYVMKMAQILNFIGIGKLMKWYLNFCKMIPKMYYFYTYTLNVIESKSL